MLNFGQKSVYCVWVITVQTYILVGLIARHSTRLLPSFVPSTSVVRARFFFFLRGGRKASIIFFFQKGITASLPR